MKFKNYVAMLAVSLCVMSCDDNDDVAPTPDPVKSQLTVNTSDYGTWTYIDLKTGKTQTLRDFSTWNYLTEGNIVETVPPQGSQADITIDWQIAIHRYDIKTNGGEAVATTERVMANVTTMPENGYTTDQTVRNTLLTDMSGMADSKLGYAATADMNPVLCGWLKKTATGAMPPYTYDPTHLIYVLKCKDGSYAKLQFTDYTDSEGKSGYVTFSYEYIAK